MHTITFVTAIITSFGAVAYAGAPLWTQCGGVGWTGPTVCDAGACTYFNEWFSQCIPSTTSTTTTTTTKFQPTDPVSKSTTTTTSASATCYTNLPTFSAIAVKATTPNTPVTGSSLQKRSDGIAVLNKSGAVHPIQHSNTIVFIDNGGTCKYKDYLNIYNDPTSPAASYKVLKFERDAPLTTYWSTTTGPLLPLVLGVFNPGSWHVRRRSLASMSSTYRRAQTPHMDRIVP